MKKITVSILVSAIAMIAAAIAIGYLFNVIFPSVQTEYENTALFRPWDDPLMYLYFIQPFILSAVLIWGWDKVKSHFRGSVGKKAFDVTMIYLMLSIIPGMLMSISTFKVSLLAIITWTISAFVQVWVASLIFIRMHK